HIRHWAEGGHTKLDNLVMVCRFHHRALHEGGFAIRVLDDGALRFIDPAGRPVQASVPMRGDLGSIVRHHEDQGPSIGPETAVTRWCGEPMDYDIAIGCLVHRRLRLKHKDNGDSAGTL
ncbi:MAG TPA: HNH endonuclease signature motif containing protein, partial [Burkholderiaceae bacterium]|nr:HNH endonuclease signature motif containing protein [Burkholderiaceae bacterium]